MEFNPLSTQNWSRAFNIWIEDIQVCFQPVMELERVLVRGGLLRKVRSLTKVSAVVVSMLFTIHCTNPRPSSPISASSAALSSATFSSPGDFELGEASWYGSDEDGFEGKPTANGELFDPTQLTCAHRTLPLGSFVEVENLENGKRAMLRVNDRGPFARGRILDASRQGAKTLGFLGQGTARVKLRLVQADGSPAFLNPASDQSDPFTVQVAALTEPMNIERLSRELRDAFGPVNLQETHTRDGVLVKRVRVGSYSRFEDAQRAAEEISKRFGDRGVEPFIIRRR
ncbi:MAG: septal ring lytic transglycosylase RlpA family protein [Holophaga sp.]